MSEQPPHVIDDIIADHRQRENEMRRHHGLHPFEAGIDHLAAREHAAAQQLAQGARHLADLFDPHRQAATATGPNPAITAQEAHPMSVLTQAQAVFEDGAARFRELAANPLIDAIAEAGLGTVLTPAEISVITGMIGAFERARANAPQQAQAQQQASEPSSDPRTR